MRGDLMLADKTTKTSPFCVLWDERGAARGQALWAFRGSHVNSTNAFALSWHTGDSFRQPRRPIKRGILSGSARTAGAPRSPPYWTRKRWQRAPSPFCPNGSLLKVLKQHGLHLSISNKCFTASYFYLDYYINVLLKIKSLTFTLCELDNLLGLVVTVVPQLFRAVSSHWCASGVVVSYLTGENSLLWCPRIRNNSIKINIH